MIRHNRLPHVTEVCANESEVLGLSIIRFVAAGAMTGDAACWDAAHDCAESVLGWREGSALVAAMACLVRALRRQRTTAFTCLPAPCCRVAPDECELLDLLSLARREDCADLPVAAARLSGAADGALLAEAARAAGEALDRAQERLLPPDGWAPFGRAASVH
jgi:hypothetical protein